MQIIVETKPFAALETEALVSYVFEETDLVQGRISEIDQSANGLLRNLAKSGELTGKTLEMTLIHAPAGRRPRDCCWSGRGSANSSQCYAAKNGWSGAALFEARSVKQFRLPRFEKMLTAEDIRANHCGRRARG